VTDGPTDGRTGDSIYALQYNAVARKNAQRSYEFRRYDVMTSWWPAAECRWRLCAISETGTQSAARYRGAVPMRQRQIKTRRQGVWTLPVNPVAVRCTRGKSSSSKIPEEQLTGPCHRAVSQHCFRLCEWLQCAAWCCWCPVGVEQCRAGLRQRGRTSSANDDCPTASTDVQPHSQLHRVTC